MWRRTEVTTQAEFFQQHAVDGAIPDNLMGDFLSLPPGDIALSIEGSGATPSTQETLDPEDAPASSPAPAPAAAPASAPAPAAATPQVVLAKDGLHTIPYERLEEARALAAQAKQQAEQAAQRAADLEAENQRLRTAAAAPSPAPAPSTAPAPAPTQAEAGLFGDYSDTALAAGIDQARAQPLRRKRPSRPQAIILQSRPASSLRTCSATRPSTASPASCPQQAERRASGHHPPPVEQRNADRALHGPDTRWPARKSPST
jgi:hypothetical protein